MAILPFPLTQEERLSINGKGITLSTDKLPLGGLPRNSVVSKSDRPDMASAAFCGGKVSNQTNKHF